MNKLKVSAIALFALILAGCAQTSRNVNSSFVKTTPKPETVAYIVKRDRPFAEQVNQNNKAGREVGLWR